MVDGTGTRGRPRREWLDDIKEWCQMDVHSANILAQSRIDWRQFVKRVATRIEPMDRWIDEWMDGWMDKDTLAYNTAKIDGQGSYTQRCIVTLISQF